MSAEKAEYLEKINGLLTRCNDIALLDLIMKLLFKSNKSIQSI